MEKNISPIVIKTNVSICGKLSISFLEKKQSSLPPSSLIQCRIQKKWRMNIDGELHSTNPTVINKLNPNVRLMN